MDQLASLLDIAPYLLHTSITAGLAWLCISTDGRPQRLHKLAINRVTVEHSRIIRASRWTNARVGLLNHAALAEGCGLLFPCRKSVHMRGMLFAIDVVFLDADGKILNVVESALPGRKEISAPAGTRFALELTGGYAKQILKHGDLVELL